MSERIQNVQPREYNGNTYRSTLEAKTAQTLDKIGIPFDYETRKIELLEGFRCPYQKDKVRAITYTPDFMIGPIMLECKGFETPEWKIKKKLIFKYLMENEPETCFYQIHDAGRQLLKALDNHWLYLGCVVKVTPKPSKKPTVSKYYDSVQQAMQELGFPNRAIGPILKSLTGEKEYVYGYNWKIEKINL